MAFVDEIKFSAKAGRGGDGVVRWRQEKFIDRGGPNGGNGGRGGSVYIQAVRDVGLLFKMAHRKAYGAENGHPGEGQSKHGRDGEDLTIDLPVGCNVRLVNKDYEFTLEKEGEKIKILSGGNGGLGNEYFKSSINQAPKKFTEGKDGEEDQIEVSLELFADIGLVGLPNAGKSSLLNAMTNANSKVANYAFTTLEPALGDFYGYIIADIPGLIEGASQGKGLGIKFLKHIKRTKKLLHLVSFENSISENRNDVSLMLEKYNNIRNELATFAQGLDEKDEIILLTKEDMVTAEQRDAFIQEFHDKTKKQVYSISLFNDESINNFKKTLAQLLED